MTRHIHIEWIHALHMRMHSDTSAKEPFHSAKEPFISAKELLISAKSPLFPHKSSLFPQKSLVSTNTSVRQCTSFFSQKKPTKCDMPRLLSHFRRSFIIQTNPGRKNDNSANRARADVDVTLRSRDCVLISIDLEPPRYKKHGGFDHSQPATSPPSLSSPITQHNFARQPLRKSPTIFIDSILGETVVYSVIVLTRV